MSVGWWEEEAAEGKDHPEWLFGLQWLHHLSRERPHRAAEPRGAFESAAKQQGAVGYMHLNSCVWCVCLLKNDGEHFVCQADVTDQKVVVVSVSPQSRASLAAHYNLSSGEAGTRLTSFFKSIGEFKYYFFLILTTQSKTGNEVNMNWLRQVQCRLEYLFFSSIHYLCCRGSSCVWHQL